MVKVSVILPVYNVENYLEQCLDSVINQTLKDIEIICVNDGSTDNSLKILKEYAKKDNRFIILDENNQGAGISRKKGIDISKGEFIYLMDSDDYINNNLLELTYNSAIKHASDIVFFKARYYNEKIDYIHKYYNYYDLFKEPVNFEEDSFTWKEVKPLVFNSFVNIWTCIFNGNFLRNNDFYYPEKLSFNDVPLHVQSIIKSKRISFVPEVLYHHKINITNSITAESHKNKKVFDFFKICKFLNSFLISEQLDEELKIEFIKFKIEHYTSHLNRINDDVGKKFFNCVKKEFVEMNVTEEEYTLHSDILRINFSYIMQSNSFEEYKNKREIYNLKKMLKLEERKNSKLKKENKRIVKENEKLKNNLKKEQNKNEKILSSNSWKITKPLRKIKKVMKN